ncbi:hypothetical protein WJU23_14145 [Prosthecobacter sp. SYSU 5D2]|uniref:hypothetical protein n=1 Tax=Prosthecobacter sp. SYSU 5D2 TaxID=3134134 RepID=UPI0031FE8931
MFEKSDQQFANAAKHKSVRRQLLASLQARRKHCLPVLFSISAAAVGLLIALVMTTQVSWSSSWLVPGLLGFGLLSLIAVAISETSRFFALDTQIKVMRMMEVANGQAEAEPLLESFNP